MVKVVDPSQSRCDTLWENICDNIIGTLLNIKGKSRDTLNAPLDLQDLNILWNLWLTKVETNKYQKPYASYTLTKDKSKEFCDFIRSVQLMLLTIVDVSLIITNCLGKKSWLTCVASEGVAYYSFVIFAEANSGTVDWILSIFPKKIALKHYRLMSLNSWLRG